MIVDFDDVFSNNQAGIQVPEEILTLINQELPSNFCCYEDSEQGIFVGPSLDHLDQNIIMNVEIDQSDEKLRNALSNIPKERWLEYFYRIQKPFPVKNVRVGNEEKQIPLEQSVHNPLGDPVEITECYMYPEPFPDPVLITIKTIEGDEVILNMKRQPYESMDEIMFSNIDFPALKLTVIINEIEVKKSKIIYSVTPTKAKSVSEAVALLNALKGIYNRTAVIGGLQQTSTLIPDKAFDEEQVEAALDLWTTLKKLEEILEITFNPGAELPYEDVVFLSELKICLLDNKSIKRDHPFEHFHVGELNTKNYSMEEIVGKKKVSMNFLEGPISATLLGTEFCLYSRTEMCNFIITNIEWDDESKTSGEVYIADEVMGISWVLIRKYMTVKEAQEKILADMPQDIVEQK